METSWWAVPILVGSFGLFGVLIGSALAYLGGKKITAQQINREEQNARRQMYGMYLHASMEYIRQCDENKRLLDASKEVKKQHGGILGIEAGGEEAYIKSLEDRLEALDARIKAHRPALDEAFYTFELRSMEVALYARPAVSATIGHVRQAAAQYWAAAEGDAVGFDRAKTELDKVLAEFTVLASADSGAPGSYSIEATSRILSKWRDEKGPPEEEVRISTVNPRN